MMANCQLPPSDAMICMQNVAVNWRVFKEAYNDFATATELTGKDTEIQATTLKTMMGKEYQQILDLSDMWKKKLDKILEKVKSISHQHGTLSVYEAKQASNRYRNPSQKCQREMINFFLLE